MFSSLKQLEALGQDEHFIKPSPYKRRSTLRKTLPQVLATIAFGLLIFGVTSICVMPTIVIGAIYKEGNKTHESEISITGQQASWFGSILFIVQPIGSLTSGYIQDLFGRRRCMMLVNIPQLIGWIILYFSNTVAHLFAAAIIMGLSIGFMEAPAMSYLGEICEPHLRGTLSSLSETFLLTGILFQFSLGAILYWRYSCAASALVPFAAFIFLYFMPESPTWFMVKGRNKDAEKALMWLRGWVKPEEISEELMKLSASVNYQDLHVPHSETGSKNLNLEYQTYKTTSYLQQVKLLNQSRIYHPIILVAIFFFVGHCTSLIGLRPFLVKIFGKLDFTLSPYTVLVISGCLQASGSILCAVLIHKLGKRLITFLSLAGCIASCFLLALYFVLQVKIPWIPVSLFGLNFFCGGFGVMTLPWVLICEIFSLEARGLSAGLSAALSYIFAFIITKTYLDLEVIMQLPGVLLLYGLIGVFGMVFLYFRLPETEGKTLAEIEDFFKGVRSREVSNT